MNRKEENMDSEDCMDIDDLTSDHHDEETGDYTPPTRRELLTAVRDLVRDNPERHDQGHWIANRFTSGYSLPRVRLERLRPYALAPIPEVPLDGSSPVCGTKACVAGWAVILGENPVALVRDDEYIWLPGGARSIQDRARELLSLTGRQASWLFSACRSREEVLKGLDALIADPSADLEDLSKVTCTVVVLGPDGELLHAGQVRVEQDDKREMAEEALRIGREDH